MEGVNCVFRSILCEKDLDVRDKKSAIIDFIAAGIETFANTLIFVLSYVATDDRNHLSQIANEFDECPFDLDACDLARAAYSKACLQETYRICPTAFCLARVLYEDTTLSGYDLKAGVSIFLQLPFNRILCVKSINFNFIFIISLTDFYLVPKYDFMS